MNTFKLKSGNTLTVTHDQIEGLVKLAQSECTSDIQANLQTDYVYQTDHQIITGKFGDILNAQRDLNQIVFSDPEISHIFVKEGNYYRNRFSDKEAESFTQLPTACNNNSSIQSFEQINEFVNLQTLNMSNDSSLTELNIDGLNSLQSIDLTYTAAGLEVDDASSLRTLHLGNPSKLHCTSINSSVSTVQDFSNIDSIDIEGCSDNLVSLGIDIINAVDFTDADIEDLLKEYKNGSNLITPTSLDSITELSVTYGKSTKDLVNCKNLKTLTIPDTIEDLYVKGISKLYSDNYTFNTVSIDNCSRFLAAEILDKL